jgi:peptidoglycan/LPS O-acetylase OafA/YrhL
VKSSTQGEGTGHGNERQRRFNGRTEEVGWHILVGVAVVVAVFFVINTFLVNSLDVLSIWYVLDILMVIGLALGLIFNYLRKREEAARSSDGAVTRGYLAANVAFYATAGITILFLHNWFTLLALGPALALGPNTLEGNQQAWIIWAVVDTLLPLTLGASGCALLCGNSSHS